MPLYPAIAPYAQHRVPVQAPHELYVEQSGNPHGIAVVFLHGGPGGGCDANSRRFFDPSRYRIITFDQRASGRSTPYACLEHNDTWALVEDLERLREFLQIEKWLVFGGSWGSTLALCYAQKHVERVLALVLRGIFLCREQDLHWLYQDGASRLFPEAWQHFLAPIEPSKRGDMIGAYYQKLTSTDTAEQLAAAKAWAQWEGRIATLLPSADTLEAFTERAVAIARLECHYFVHKGFLASDQLLQNMPVLAKVPGVIVHGRYDAVCAADNAWALHQAWPASRLEIVEQAGHSASEPGILEALVRATDHFAAVLA